MTSYKNGRRRSSRLHPEDLLALDNEPPTPAQHNNAPTTQAAQLIEADDDSSDGSENGHDGDADEQQASAPHTPQHTSTASAAAARQNRGLNEGTSMGLAAAETSTNGAATKPAQSTIPQAAAPNRWRSLLQPKGVLVVGGACLVCLVVTQQMASAQGRAAWMLHLQEIGDMARILQSALIAFLTLQWPASTSVCVTVYVLMACMKARYLRSRQSSTAGHHQSALAAHSRFSAKQSLLSLVQVCAVAFGGSALASLLLAQPYLALTSWFTWFIVPITWLVSNFAHKDALAKTAVLPGVHQILVVLAEVNTL